MKRKKQNQSQGWTDALQQIRRNPDSSLDSNSSLSTVGKEILIMTYLFFNAQSIEEGKYWQNSVLTRIPMDERFYKLKYKQEDRIEGKVRLLKWSCINRSEAREWYLPKRGSKRLNNNWLGLVSGPFLDWFCFAFVFATYISWGQKKENRLKESLDVTQNSPYWSHSYLWIIMEKQDTSIFKYKVFWAETWKIVRTVSLKALICSMNYCY